MKKVFCRFALASALGIMATSAYAVDPNYSFTGCTSFNMGYGLLATHESVGQTKCYDTYSAVPTKIEAIATNQPAGVNYDIFVYWYNSTTATLELKASGTKTGNVDERALAVVPAGNYVIYTKATTGFSATQFVVGALSYTAYDAHEMNDTVLTAKQL